MWNKLQVSVYICYLIILFSSHKAPVYFFGTVILHKEPMLGSCKWRKIAYLCCRQLISAEQFLTDDLVDAEHHRFLTKGAGTSIEYQW